MNSIRIGLVEDQHLFRKGIISILAQWPEVEVVFEAADGFSVVEALQSAQALPHVLLVDVSLPPNGSAEYNGRKYVTRNGPFDGEVSSNVIVSIFCIGSNK